MSASADKKDVVGGSLGAVLKGDGGVLYTYQATHWGRT